MKNISSKILLLLFGMIMSVKACDRPTCSNDNLVFDNYQPQTNEYKAELVKQLKNLEPDALRYWVGFYSEKNDERFLTTHLQGDGLCAYIVLDLSKSIKGLENVVKSKGAGYRGAELKGLKFDTLRDSSGIVFSFRSVDSVAD